MRGASRRSAQLIGRRRRSSPPSNERRALATSSATSVRGRSRCTPRRRAIQTTSLQRMAEVADYYAMKRDSSYWQPSVDDGDIEEYGMSIAWQDANWILYRFGDD